MSRPCVVWPSRSLSRRTSATTRARSSPSPAARSSASAKSSRSGARCRIGAASILAPIVRLHRNVAFACVLAALCRPAPAAERPRLLGISHAAFRVGDVAKARAFYQDLLGYTVEPTRDGLRVAVNDRQYVSVRAGLVPSEDRLDHLALETDDVEAMRRSLHARGASVSAMGQDESGNRAFTVRDPEGWTIEVVQHAPRTWPRAAPFSPAALSRRILHAGVLVGDLDAANRFYGGVLGLVETWRGSRTGTELSWTNMKLPEGDDYIEFMLYAKL